MNVLILLSGGDVKSIYILLYLFHIILIIMAKVKIDKEYQLFNSKGDSPAVSLLNILITNFVGYQFSF